MIPISSNAKNIKLKIIRYRYLSIIVSLNPSTGIESSGKGN